jgi:hypothetical protein
MLRCRSIASLQHTLSTPPLVDFRAPRTWIFLSSLQEAFFSTLLVKEFGFEVIIAKRRDACYESGKRSGAWLKYKVNKAQALVIGGIRQATRSMR